MIFTAKQRSFYLNKQPFFLYSGEIHYVEMESWALPQKIKAAGALPSSYTWPYMNMRRVL